MQKLKTALLFTTLGLAIGVAGHMEFKADQVEQAAITCENQDATTIPTKEQCINNQLEVNNDK